MTTTEMTRAAILALERELSRSTTEGRTTWVCLQEGHPILALRLLRTLGRGMLATVTTLSDSEELLTLGPVALASDGSPRDTLLQTLYALRDHGAGEAGRKLVDLLSDDERAHLRISRARPIPPPKDPK